MSVIVLLIIFVLLLIVSGFFSASETGMTAVNRYRLRHKVRKNNPAAKRVSALLKNPDRLLGVILLGNTFANVVATSIGTLLAVHWFGPVGAVYATIALTAIILVFCESAPKTWAVMHAQTLAYRISWILKGLSWLLYPFVWALSSCAKVLLFLVGTRVRSHAHVDQISEEELHTLVGDAAGGMAANAQTMLLRMLELKAAQAADVMVPRNDIYGVDVSQSMPEIEKRLMEAPHRYVPLYDTYMDELRGVISVRQALSALAEGVLTKEKLLDLAQKNYFIPETAPLNKQLVYFQHKRCNFAFVVDEYGDIQGVVTLKDILEDIIGEFEEEVMDIDEEDIEVLPNGAYLVDGMLNLRELNRVIGTQLPLGGPKTLSGLIIAYLDGMPTHPCCVKVHGVKMELMNFSNRAIHQVKLYGK